jgi:hypothetical protein
LAARHQPIHFVRRLGVPSRLRQTGADLPTPYPTRLDRHFQSTADLANCVPPSLLYGGTGILSPFPIDYAFQPRLRGRLTLGRLPLPRKPRAFGGQVFHLSFRYSCLHPHFRYLQHTLSVHLRRHTERSPTRSSLLKNCQSAASVSSLSPVTLSAREYSTSELLRTLSRYGCF